MERLTREEIIKQINNSAKTTLDMSNSIRIGSWVAINAVELLASDAAEILALKAEVERLRTERRWIPCSEKLPHCNKPVQTFTQGMALPVITDWYNGYYGEDDNEWYEGWNSGRNITHWMPLPEPPKEDANVKN